MQLETPLWKRVVVWAAVLVGLILAAPNLFYSRVETHNDAASAIAKAEKLGGLPRQTKPLPWRFGPHGHRLVWST